MSLLTQKSPMAPHYLEENSAHGQGTLHPGPIYLFSIWTLAKAKWLLHCPLSITCIFLPPFYPLSTEYNTNLTHACGLRSNFTLCLYFPDHARPLPPPALSSLQSTFSAFDLLLMSCSFLLLNVLCVWILSSMIDNTLLEGQYQILPFCYPLQNPN